MTLSNTEAALLVLLAEGPAHPYQLDKLIADRSMDEWSELSRSTVYKTLAKLEAKGLAWSEGSLTERNVGRRTYAISVEGQDALKETLLTYLSKPERAVWRVDLATSHLGLLDPGEVEAALDRYAAELEANVECYGKLEEYLVASGCSGPSLALARRPRFLFLAELEWLREFRADCGLPSKKSNTGTRGSGDTAAGGSS